MSSQLRQDSKDPALQNSSPYDKSGEGAEGPAGENKLMRLLRERSVQAGLLFWAACSAAIPFLAHGTVPFNRPEAAGMSYRAQVATEITFMPITLVFIWVVYLLTRRRDVNISERAAEREIALQETIGLLAYGAIVLAGGEFLGHVVGTHAIGLHLAGSMFDWRTW